MYSRYCDLGKIAIVGTLGGEKQQMLVLYQRLKNNRCTVGAVTGEKIADVGTLAGGNISFK
jgi:hypothetical protein